MALSYLVHIAFPIGAIKRRKSKAFWNAAINTARIDGPMVWVASRLVKRFYTAFTAKCVTRLPGTETVSFKRPFFDGHGHVFMQNIDMKVARQATNAAIAVDRLNGVSQYRRIAQGPAMAAAGNCSHILAPLNVSPRL